ncbi:MAG TPA: hydroxymethylpyrimidine/phosphomethylpyrimidine kinase [Telluria sp.]|jgi:hydroxymethylpyrimidine/phosphomethylpyrimidine kinase
MNQRPTQRTVMVFSGLDPSGGAGIAADLTAIAAQGVHALPLITALTVQDQNRVHDIAPVEPSILLRQARALIDAVPIDAVKIGIPGSRANAEAIAAIVTRLRERNPALPVVLDPVLASGHGDMLSRGNALDALAPLLPLVTVLTPNLAEAQAIDVAQCLHVLVTGGHGTGPQVINRWHGPAETREWQWERLRGEFHGSGCTLAAALAARLALGESIADALGTAQVYVQRALAASFSIGPGQRIPQRFYPHD